MSASVVVTYTLKPEAYEEHVGLIRRVFDQLAAEGPTSLDYQVMCLADGVSFVHFSTHDTDDGVSPLTQLGAFREFGRELADRVATPPNPSAATIIGAYRGLA
ncbi:hypothetical protein acdb102_49350 [Acidothermaceae bacterium B102]|nr:hypothetical protein acdb102_49350 [Acidothermaceae bacterium B102]